MKYRIWKLVNSYIAICGGGYSYHTIATPVIDAIHDDFIAANAAADILREKDSVNSYIIQVYDVIKGR